MTNIYKIDELRAELGLLLEKQSATLNARVSGGVSDEEILEFDLREDVISEIQERLARCKAA